MRRKQCWIVMLGLTSGLRLDGGGGILDEKTRGVLCRGGWRVGSEAGRVGHVGGVNNLHPVTLQAANKSWNFGKFVLVELKAVIDMS